MAPAQVPDREQPQGHGGDVGAPEPTRTAAQEDVDSRRGGKGDAEAGEAEGDRQQQAGDAVAATVFALQHQHHPQPRQDRADEADLERPQQHLPGGPDEEQQSRRHRRRPRPEATADVDEEQVGGRRQHQDQEHVFRQRRGHPEDRQQQLLDRHRDQDDVLVVRFEEGVDGELAPVHEEGPGVLVEGEPGGQDQQEDARGHQGQRQRDQGRARGASLVRPRASERRLSDFALPCVHVGCRQRERWCGGARV